MVRNRRKYVYNFAQALIYWCNLRIASMELVWSEFSVINTMNSEYEKKMNSAFHGSAYQSYCVFE